jgi:hypothetical protein
MNTLESQLKKDVMLRIRMIFFMRYLLNPELLKAEVLVISCAAIGFIVSVPNVIHNMSRLPDVIGDADYLYVAFLNTSLVVEVALTVALAAAIWLAFDLANNLKNSRPVRSLFGLRDMAAV